MPVEDLREEFVTQLTATQGRLAAYVRALVPNTEAAKDVLQETNLVLWRKAAQFEPGTNFAAWACKIARYQAMAYRRDAGRERLLFDDELTGLLAVTAERRGDLFERRQLAMRACLQKLGAQPREIVRAKYDHTRSVAELADQFDRTQEAIKKVLFRARRELLYCIERSLSAEGQL